MRRLSSLLALNSTLCLSFCYSNRVKGGRREGHAALGPCWLCGLGCNTKNSTNASPVGLAPPCIVHPAPLFGKAAAYVPALVFVRSVCCFVVY